MVDVKKEMKSCGLIILIIFGSVAILGAGAYFFLGTSNSSTPGFSKSHLPKNAEEFIVREMQAKASLFRDQYSITCYLDNSRGTVAVVNVTEPKFQDGSFHKYLTFVLEKDQINTNSYISNYNYISSKIQPTAKDINDAGARFQ